MKPMPRRIIKDVKSIKCTAPCRADIDVRGKKSGDVVKCPCCGMEHILEIVSVAHKISDEMLMAGRK